jgi:hypothetical protein
VREGGGEGERERERVGRGVRGVRGVMFGMLKVTGKGGRK